jgi:hypothetical protein
MNHLFEIVGSETFFKLLVLVLVVHLPFPVLVVLQDQSVH